MEYGLKFKFGGGKCVLNLNAVPYVL